MSLTNQENRGTLQGEEAAISTQDRLLREAAKLRIQLAKVEMALVISEKAQNAEQALEEFLKVAQV